MANGIIDRTGADALIPVELSSEVFSGIVEASSMLSMGRRLPDMTAKQLRLPVLNSLPGAYFVSGDVGLKRTSELDWTNKLIVAEEIAVIVPVPDAVIEDSGFDMWSHISPLVTQAFGQVIDRAILFGTDRPASWPEGIVTQLTAKSKAVTSTANAYLDVCGKDGLIAKVEQSGYMVSGFVGSMPARGVLRTALDTSGQPLFRPAETGSADYRIDGQPVVFPRNGAIDETKLMLLGGDFNQLVYAIRQDLTVKLLTEAVITDDDGKIIYNLPQQDMSALRFVMRLGWQLPNPQTAIGGAQRFPFAMVKPAA